MIVDSKNIEFGYELISVLPYAYYLHSIGQLEKTISGNDTECLYYFSPEHVINPTKRSWFNTRKVKTPNIKIHKSYLDKSQFLPPPLKEQYKNDIFKFDKETVVICNRHNIEWNKKPINFFDLRTLRRLFELLQDKYQVVYINIEGRPELYDNAPPISMCDYALLKEYPKVYNIHYIGTNLSFNELQLMIFANCSKFITMNGGHAILTSYFGGENIIMSKHGKPEAQEIKKSVNSFYRWYSELGDQRVIHVDTENKLVRQIKSKWIDNDPIVNILVRTSSRPGYFAKCIESITNQTYKNINIFVSIDTEGINGNDYTTKYPVYPVKVEKKKYINKVENNPAYGRPFPSNLYLNDLQDKVKTGLILYLDDDDKLSSKNSIQTIVDEYKRGNELIFWKVISRKRVIPCDENWKKAPVVCDFSGIGMAFDSKYKHLAEWEAWKRGDFRVGTKLYNEIKMIKFIDKKLTQTQDGQGGGKKKDIIKNEVMEKPVKIEIIKDTFRGKKTKHNKGEIKEVPYTIAMQLIAHKLAKKVGFDKVKPVKKVVDTWEREPVEVEEVKKKPRKKRTTKKVNKVITHKK